MDVMLFKAFMNIRDKSYKTLENDVRYIKLKDHGLVRWSKLTNNWIYTAKGHDAVASFEALYNVIFR